MTERRFFNDRERAALYLAADGKCTGCGVELEPSWHADHIDPHSLGGATDVINGQALCPPCNLKKGASRAMKQIDRFQPRPFQRDVIQTVLDGMASGRNVSVVLASPGSGKTLGYQGAGTYAYREGQIDFLAVFVPRIILARQCEISWRHSCPDGHCPEDRRSNGVGGYHLMFNSAGRIGPIRHVRNAVPLLPPGQTGIGFVSTYSALVASPDIYESWARRHKGRFLLVADEAQFCGAANDERSGGTQAGARILDLHQHAAHTLLLTGTPYRSDGQPLILADYDEVDEQGNRKLLANAEASYADGIAEGYLRRFEASVHEIRVRKKMVSNTVIEYNLSTSGEDLAEVLRKPEVWRAVADRVVVNVQEKQRIHPDYRGLISCMEQKDAKNVATYLASRYPGLRIKLAISEDGPEAERALREFQTEPADVLVTVRKAFIGYDCPEITVVGVLTHYRDKGHLMQLVGRGLRVWSGTPARAQSCRVVAPDDPLMEEFIDYMRGQSEEGLRERARRESQAETKRAKPDDEELSYVESATPTTVRAVSNDAEVDNEERLLYEAIKYDLGLVEDVTNLAKFLDAVSFRARTEPDAPPQEPRPTTAVPLSEQEIIDQLKAKTADEIRSYVASRGINPKDPTYRDHIAKVTAHVNSRPGSCAAAGVRTVEQAEARYAAACQLRASVS